MSEHAELTLRLPPELVAHLDEIAAATGRSHADLAQEALEQYLDVQGWQIEGIRSAIAEADRGKPGVPHEQVAAWLEFWGTDNERPRDDPAVNMPEAYADRLRPAEACSTEARELRNRVWTRLKT